uniref:Uncharacterized protein n=1 Tax=Tetradesmus obliquus TaxID=3088 RepID=A0A383WAQ5_TETOB|eukprot:jgi/Sobl393_1/3246/SZX73766.1
MAAMESVNRSCRPNKTLYSLPVHCLTKEDLNLENSRGVMQHFHRPENRNNRFMASLTEQERAILRDVERPLLYSTKQQQQQQVSEQQEAAAAAARSPTRPFSAGHVSGSRARQHRADPAIQQAMSTTTQKGVPCYSMEAVVSADIIEGRPASAQQLRKEPWRAARVKSYAVPVSKYGHGEAGVQAFHQNYAWYRYYGFAGKGAKTSWASNPTKHLGSNKATEHHAERS